MERVRSGRGRAAKRVLALLRAALARDAEALRKALVAWLGYYRDAEFPKDTMTKTITFEGTIFVHRAEREGMPVVVPAEFADSIVDLP